ncbi:anaphase promoting complex subunit 5 [Sugiyamaella lignohabitans]|uniref:Anaphase-promoting complex subunit 5 n=1 Tax=Sugiyamaella lignohabitans TaxID=796027 RepID=A0A167CWM6_9ASCO|nr:anaphase promoting complex subunit 5 [Sugiyamaella lignohabitans]ANB12192.1 anaphase promoting complex subunit 5 [Sugiyamaella lignohabitans]
MKVIVEWIDGGFRMDPDEVLKNSSDGLESSNEREGVTRLSWGDLRISDLKKILVGSGGSLGSDVYKTFITNIWTWDSYDGLFDFFLGLDKYLVSPFKPESSQNDGDEDNGDGDDDDDEDNYNGNENDDDNDNEYDSNNRSGVNRARDNAKQARAPRLKLVSNSVLGNFFRKCFLAFERLEFDKMLGLWRDFEQFREETRTIWEEIHLNIYKRGSIRVRKESTPLSDNDELASNPSFLIPQSPGEEDPSEKCIPALAHLISGDNDRFRSSPLANNKDGKDNSNGSGSHSSLINIKLSDETMEAIFENQVDQFQKHGSILPKHVVSVMEELVRIQSLKGSLPPSAYFLQYLEACRNRDHEKAFENLHRFYDYSMDSRGKSHYQYALFTLATLHAEFNNSSEAIRAAQEAIAVAHENMDIACLTQILSWLYSYLQNNPHCSLPVSLASKEQIGQFLLAKSWDVSPLLASLSFQNDVIQVLGNGRSGPPTNLTNIFESLIKASFINITTNSPLTMASLNLVQSTLWNRLGVDVVSDMYLDNCLTLTTPANPSSSLHLGNSSAYLQAACIKAHKLLLQGHVTKSFDLLNSLKPLADRSIAYQQIWLPNALILHIWHALKENRLAQVDIYIQRLTGLFIASPYITHSAQLAEIELDLLSGNTSRAIDKTVKYVETSNDPNTDILFQLQYMIRHIRALCKSGRPTRAFSITLRCFQMAQRSALVPAVLESLILLTTILISRQDHRDALSILDTLVPKVSACDAASGGWGCTPDPAAPLASLESLRGGFPSGKLTRIQVLECGYVSLVSEVYENMAGATVGVASGEPEDVAKVLYERAFRYTVEAAKCKYFRYERRWTWLTKDRLGAREQPRPAAGNLRQAEDSGSTPGRQSPIRKDRKHRSHPRGPAPHQHQQNPNRQHPLITTWDPKQRLERSERSSGVWGAAPAAGGTRPQGVSVMKQ